MCCSNDAQARLAEAAAKVQRTEGSKKRKAAIAAGEDTDAKPKTSGAGQPNDEAAIINKPKRRPAGSAAGGGGGRQPATKPKGSSSATQHQRRGSGASAAGAAGGKAQKAQPTGPAQQKAAAAPTKQQPKQQPKPQPAKQTAASSAQLRQDAKLFDPLASKGTAASGSAGSGSGDAVSEFSDADSSEDGQGNAHSGGSDAGTSSSSGGGSSGGGGGSSVADDNGAKGSSGSGGGADNSSGGGGGQQAGDVDHETRTAAAMMSVEVKSALIGLDCISYFCCIWVKLLVSCHGLHSALLWCMSATDTLVAVENCAYSMPMQPEKKERPKRKRKTDTKFLVLPAHKCQLLDDPLANACMYGGLDAAKQPECMGAFAALSFFTPRSQLLK